MARDIVTLEELRRELGLGRKKGKVADLPLAPPIEALTAGPPHITLETTAEMPAPGFSKENPLITDALTLGMIPFTRELNEKERQIKKARLDEKGRSYVATGVELGLEFLFLKGGGKVGQEVAKQLPKVPGFLKGLLPEVGGAGGVFAGDQTAQGIERAFFPPGGGGAEFGSPQSIERSVRDAKFAGGFGITAKGIGAGISKFPGIAALKNLNEEERKFARIFFKKMEEDPSFVVNPSIIAPQSKFFAFQDNILENALTTGTSVAESIKSVGKFLADVMRNKASKLIAKSDPGELVKRLAADELRIYSDTLSATAVKIDLLSSTRIFINNPISFLRKEFKDAPVGLVRRKELRIAQRFDLERGGDKTISIGENQAIINDLTSDIRKLRGKKVASRGTAEDISPDDRFASKLETLRSKLINQQSQQIKAAGDPDLSNMLKVFNQVQLGGAKKFNIDVLQEVVKLSDEAAGVLYTTIRNANKLRNIKSHIGNTAWRKVEGATYQDLIRRSVTRDPVTGEKALNGLELLNNLDAVDDKIASVVFNKVTKRNFESFAKMLTRVQGPRATSLGSVFIELVQAGVVTGLFFVGMDTEATIILLGPFAIDKIFSTPAVSKMMVNMASRPSISSSAKTALFVSFLGLLTEHGIDFQRKPVGGGQSDRVEDPFNVLSR